MTILGLQKILEIQTFKLSSKLIFLTFKTNAFENYQEVLLFC